MELRQELRRIAQFRRQHELPRDRRGHRSVWAREVPRVRRMERPTAGQQRGEAIAPWRVAHALDQTILDRVGGGIDELAHDVSRIDEPDDTDLFTGPKFSHHPRRAFWHLAASCENAL